MHMTRPTLTIFQIFYTEDDITPENSSGSDGVQHASEQIYCRIRSVTQPSATHVPQCGIGNILGELKPHRTLCCVFTESRTEHCQLNS